MKTFTKINPDKVFLTKTLKNTQLFLKLLNQLVLPNTSNQTLAGFYKDFIVIKMYVVKDENKEILEQLILDEELYNNYHEVFFTNEHPAAFENYISLQALFLQYNNLTGDFIRLDENLNQTFFI